MALAKLQALGESFEFSLPTSTEQLQDALSNVWEYVSTNKSKSVLGFCFGLLVLRYPVVVLRRKLRRLPPGPIGLPLIGDMHMRYAYSLSSEGGGWFTFLTKKYGALCLYHSGPMPVVVLSHSELVKQVLVKKQMNDRAPRQSGLRGYNIAASTTGHGPIPFIFENGTEWKRRRKFAFDLLTSMPSGVLHEITDMSLGETLLPALEDVSKQGSEWNPTSDLLWLALNTLYHYGVGVPCNKEDDFWKKYTRAIESTFKKIIPSLWLSILPFLQKTSYAKQFDDLIRERTALTEKMIEKREELLQQMELQKEDDSSKNVLKETYIDGMLQHLKNGNLTRGQMISDIGSLFLAGTDTSASTTQISIMLFAKHQDMQTRFRNVCEKIWETSGKPMIGEKKQFKAFRLQMLLGAENKQVKNEFKAFFYELLRITSVAGHGISHFNNSGKEIVVDVKKEHGTIDNKDHTYVIPNKCLLMHNTEFIHRYSDWEKEWRHYTAVDSNKEFCLENWFENGDMTNGKLKRLSSMPLMSFGMGSRVCVGQQMASNQVKVFIATLILNFEFELDKKKHPDASKVEFEMNRQLTTTIISPNSVRVSRV